MLCINILKDQGTLRFTGSSVSSFKWRDFPFLKKCPIVAFINHGTAGKNKNSSALFKKQCNSFDIWCCKARNIRKYQNVNVLKVDKVKLLRCCELNSEERGVVFPDTCRKRKRNKPNILARR